MGKVSIGFRGWRFDEDEVFDSNGRVRPLDNMEPDTRERVLRLSGLFGEPCDACYLQFSDDRVERCKPAQAVYGEPGGEVLLCNAHEADFVYWFQSAGGREFAGEAGLKDRFHEWFAGGGRAPEAFAVEHVEESPGGVPEAPDPQAEIPGIEAEIEQMPEEEIEALDVSLSDLEFD